MSQQEATFAFREIGFQLWERRQTHTLDLNIPLKIKEWWNIYPPRVSTHVPDHIIINTFTSFTIICIKFIFEEEEDDEDDNNNDNKVDKDNDFQPTYPTI